MSVYLQAADGATVVGATNNVKHARLHGITIVNPRRFPSRRIASTTSSTVSTPSILGYMVPRGEEATLRKAFNHQRYIEALITLFTVHRLPFSAIEYGAIKEFALACNPDIDDMLLTSRTTLMRHLKANFSLYSDQLKESLQSTVSMIHFSTDLWTSPHKHSMLAICVQWLDADYNLRKALLGLAECRYSHSGSTQAAIIMEYFKTYRITHRLGYHTADNATSNDTCLRAISAALRDEHNVRNLVHA